MRVQLITPTPIVSATIHIVTDDSIVPITVAVRSANKYNKIISGVYNRRRDSRTVTQIGLLDSDIAVCLTECYTRGISMNFLEALAHLSHI